MNSFQSLTQQLALQADRKILESQEADYLRLDLSAHEKATWSVFALPRGFAFAQMKRFVFTALALYMVLFSITNAQAYTKIALDSVQTTLQNYEESRPSMSANKLEVDPWTGERHAENLLKTDTPNSVNVQTSEPEDYLPLLSTPGSYENRIQIPSLSINAPIVEPSLGLEAVKNGDWESLEGQIQDALTSGVVHFPGTAEPGQTGNTFLTGHSSNVFWQQSAYNTIFALLPKINVGDEILITYNQTAYRYTVTEKKEVSPKDVSVLKQGDEKTLSLVTCTPVGTALRRLVVTATLVE